jgi:MerR family transcriptional regulator, light-induced transcriptional regulator
VSTLRAWERRYDFPVPERLESGHRRYTDRDVEAIRSALRERHRGTPIGTAIERARVNALGPRSSVFGALRHALTGISPTATSKAGMLALSRGIEDETAAHADRPILFGGFQREHFWRASEQRWRSLAMTSSVSVIMAMLPRGRRRGALWEVPIDPATQLAREWVVICDSPTFSACLAAVELPPADVRIFETLWTTEPAVVRDVARVAAAITVARQPALTETLRDALQGPLTHGYDSVRATTSLTNRVVGHLAAPGTMPSRPR